MARIPSWRKNKKAARAKRAQLGLTDTGPIPDFMRRKKSALKLSASMGFGYDLDFLNQKKEAAKLDIGFAAQTGVALSTVIESNIITITPAMAGPISIVGGTYRKNGGTYVNTTGSVVAGDTVQTRVTSSATNDTPVVATPTINGVAYPFIVTTVSVIVAPGPTLGDLVLTGTLTQGSPASGVTISGFTDGSSAAFNIPGISVSTSGTTRTVTGTPTGLGPLNVTQTLAGATNSPKTNNNIGTVIAGAALNPLPAANISSEYFTSKGTASPMMYGATGAGAVARGSKIYFSVQEENRLLERKEMSLFSFDRSLTGDNQWSPRIMGLAATSDGDARFYGPAGRASNNNGKDGDHGHSPPGFTVAGRPVVAGFWHGTVLQLAMGNVPESVGNSDADWTRIPNTLPIRGTYTHLETVNTALNPNTMLIIYRGNGVMNDADGKSWCTAQKLVFTGPSETPAFGDSVPLFNCAGGNMGSDEDGFAVAARHYNDSTWVSSNGKDINLFWCWADQGNAIKAHIFGAIYDVDTGKVRPYGSPTGVNEDTPPVLHAVQLSKYLIQGTYMPGRTEIPKVAYDPVTGKTYLTYVDQPARKVNSATSRLMIHTPGSGWSAPIAFPQGAEIPDHKPIELLANGGVRFYCAGPLPGVYYIERSASGVWGSVTPFHLKDQLIGFNADDVGYIVVGQVRNGPEWAKRIISENTLGTYYGAQNRVLVEGNEGKVRYARAARRGDLAALKYSTDYQSAALQPAALENLSNIMQAAYDTDCAIIDAFELAGMNNDGTQANAMRGLFTGLSATFRGSPTWTRGRGVIMNAENDAILLPINMAALHTAGDRIRQHFWSIGLEIENDIDGVGFDVGIRQSNYLQIRQNSVNLKTGGTADLYTTTEGSSAGWWDYNRIGGVGGNHFMAHNGKNLAPTIDGTQNGPSGFDAGSDLFIGARATTGAGVTCIGRRYKRVWVMSAKLPANAARFAQKMAIFNAAMKTHHGL